MNCAIPLDSVTGRDRSCIGPGAWDLMVLGREGFSIPRSLCVTTHAHDEYVKRTGLEERILMELSRKHHRDPLREEIWDACLRIRSMFLNVPMPASLRDRLKQEVEGFFGPSAVAVRSSFGMGQPDGVLTGVVGAYPVLDRIRLLWASVCAGCAPTASRKEGSAMPSVALLVQEVISGRAHGRAFCSSPGGDGRVVVEYGMGQGATCPSGWLGTLVLEAGTCRVLSHDAPAGEAGLSRKDLPEVCGHAVKALEVLGPGREIEWVLHEGGFAVTHARQTGAGSCIAGDLTAGPGAHASADVLRLCGLVEKSFIPGIAAEADSFSARRLGELSDSELASEASRRREAHRKWAGLYRQEFEPFTRAMAAFGAIYNDAVRPVDPFEFADLLLPPELPALKKDILLEKMAWLARRDGTLFRSIRRRLLPCGSGEFAGLFRQYLECLGKPASVAREGRDVLDLVLRLAGKPPARHVRMHLDVDSLTSEFLAFLPQERRRQAGEALDAARAVCRLQNEAAIQLRRIERQEEEAIEEEGRRQALRGTEQASRPRAAQGSAPGESPSVPGDRTRPEAWVRVTARQLSGRPCSGGMARGRARVVRREGDLTGFRAGEIMVCDSLEPGIAVVVPLADAVVVEKGAVLSEGTAIARKYGLPYVTGVSEATRFIRTGDRITVDGHLGIVIIEA